MEVAILLKMKFLQVNQIEITVEVPTLFGHFYIDLMNFEFSNKSRARPNPLLFTLP